MTQSLVAHSIPGLGTWQRPIFLILHQFTSYERYSAMLWLSINYPKDPPSFILNAFQFFLFFQRYVFDSKTTDASAYSWAFPLGLLRHSLSKAQETNGSVKFRSAEPVEAATAGTLFFFEADAILRFFLGFPEFYQAFFYIVVFLSKFSSFSSFFFLGFTLIIVCCLG